MTPDDVGAVEHTLLQAIADLWAARMQPETADTILSDEYVLRVAANRLSALLEDVQHANQNRHMEAAE